MQKNIETIRGSSVIHIALTTALGVIVMLIGFVFMLKSTELEKADARIEVKADNNGGRVNDIEKKYIEAMVSIDNRLSNLERANGLPVGKSLLNQTINLNVNKKESPVADNVAKADPIEKVVEQSVLTPVIMTAKQKKEPVVIEETKQEMVIDDKKIQTDKINAKKGIFPVSS